MTPPEARSDRQTAEAPPGPPAVSVCARAGERAGEATASEGPMAKAARTGTAATGTDATCLAGGPVPDLNTASDSSPETGRDSGPVSGAGSGPLRDPESGTGTGTASGAGCESHRASTAASPGPQAARPRIPVIPKRADFLKAASARRQGTGSFLLQGRDRQDGSAGIRMGFTASKKVGNSVMRNRARRRLREVARAVLPGLARPGWDYVLVARPGATVTRPFAELLADLALALASVHREGGPKSGGPRGRQGGGGGPHGATASGGTPPNRAEAPGGNATRAPVATPPGAEAKA